MTMKKKMLTTLSVVLILGLAALGILAYLSDTDSDVNVMTLGNVKIDQIEYERTIENGAWVSTGEIDKYGYTPDKVQGFKDDKPLYPAVFADGIIKWDDRNGSQAASGDGSHQQSWAQVGASGSNQLFDDSVKNVQDKFVFVKNTGKSDAYVRTFIAFEQGSVEAENFKNVIMTNTNKDHWAWETVATDVVIKDENGVDNTYVVWVATYSGAKSNPTGILAPGATSYPSLLQIYMKPEATNADVEAIDGNDDGLYKILVASQAIQSDGFENARAALNEGFGVPSATNHPWVNGISEKTEITMNGKEYSSLALAVAAANEAGGGTIKILGTASVNEPLNIDSDIIIEGEGASIVRGETQDENIYNGNMFVVNTGKMLTLTKVVADGGAVWEGAVDSTLGRGTNNSGVTASGAIIAAGNNAKIVLGEGAVLQNNDGAHAVNLGTRIGATLEINGGEIINNSSDSGAIWGGGNITMNSGKINNNSSTGIGGAIRMVSSCNLTMNGGEICGNTAATDGGAIWGYGSSTYNFNGGKMSNNESAGTGGAIYTGTYSVINIGDGFELCDNKATNSGAIRLTDHTSMNMTGGKVSGNTQNGESNAFNTWNNTISITGGELKDNMSYVGGLGLTIGKAEIDGVIAYDLSTDHNTAYLAADFNGFEFTVNETNANFANFNFKPASGYTYTAGDEAKLVCLNTGYETYWDSTTSTFRLKKK